MSIADLYRVDTVPFWLKPFFWIYAYGLGLPLLAYCRAVRATIRLEIAREPGADERRPCVLCCWHEVIWLMFLTQETLPELSVLSHPAWYMQPIYVMLRGLGIRRFVYGSSGYQGREAADRLVATVREYGGFVGINPDGPAGPPKVLKKGALHIASQLGLPITPLRFKCAWKFRSRSWDRKWVPLPFARIRLEVGAPIRVTPENFDEAAGTLEKALG